MGKEESDIRHRLRKEYSEFYRNHEFDSPPQSSQFLIERMLDELEKNREKTLRVLNLGSGVQSLEAQLLRSERYSKLSGDGRNLTVVTMDIADIGRNQLLASGVDHVQADGMNVPVMDEGFDMVISNHAVDFMPKRVYGEVARVLKPGGVFMANLHHPKLIEKARSYLPEVLSELGQIGKTLMIKERCGSKGRFSYKRKYERKLAEYQDVCFIIEHFPDFVFASPEAVDEFFGQTFLGWQLNAAEVSDPVSNWYFVFARKPENKEVSVY